ncbi:TetR-like C-terminal domain-containing protein [Kitasatospora cystarginea]
MEFFSAALDSRAGAAMRALMAELEHEQARTFKGFIVERVLEPATLQILHRGEVRGDVRPGAATKLAAEVVPAMLLYRAKLCDGQLEPDFGAAMVDEVLLPMVRPVHLG